MKRREFIKSLGVAPLAAGLSPELEEPSILTFLNEAQFTPTPSQRLVLKLFYGLKLTPAEQAYLDELYRDGRCNTQESGKTYQRMVLVAGRRFGMSTLGSCFTAYEASLHLKAPQRVELLAVDTDREQAQGMYWGVRELSRHHEGLSAGMTKNTAQTLVWNGVRASFKNNLVKHLRGYRFSLAVLQNFDCWSYEDPEAYLRALITSMTPTGKIVVMSPSRLKTFNEDSETLILQGL